MIFLPVLLRAQESVDIGCGERFACPLQTSTHKASSHTLESNKFGVVGRLRAVGASGSTRGFGSVIWPYYAPVATLDSGLEPSSVIDQIVMASMLEICAPIGLNLD